MKMSHSKIGKKKTSSKFTNRYFIHEFSIKFINVKKTLN